MFESIDRSRAVWTGLALVLLGVLGFVLYAFVGTFVLGLFLYYAARPLYRRLQHRVRYPSVAAGVALFILVLPIILLFWYTAALGLGELQAFEPLDLEAYEELLEPYAEVAGLSEELRAVFETLLSDPRQLLMEDRLQGLTADLAGAATAYLGVVLTGLLHLFVAAALAFYLLRDGDRLAAWVRETVSDETLATYGRAVDADLKTVFFGNILNALLSGTIGAAVFSILAAVAPPAVPVPVPILLGLLVGAGSLVPVVGMKIVYVPVTLYLFGLALFDGAQSLWFPVLFFVVTVIVVDTIPDLIIRPYVSGRTLHVGAVMFAYILGPLLFGWYGLFLGPLLLVLITDFAVVVVPGLLEQDVESVVPPSNGEREETSTADVGMASTDDGPEPATDETEGSDETNSG